MAQRMIREVETNIYAISVPLKGNPLKYLNSYLIRGNERDLLIDTGFRRDSCREALEDATNPARTETMPAGDPRMPSLRDGQVINVGDYHERIDKLLVHHAKRLAEQERIIAQGPGQTAYELAGKMQWKIRARNWQEFPAIQKWFAVGECMSHLDYLLKRGRITKYEEGGFVRYKKA